VRPVSEPSRRGEFRLIADLFAPLATHPGARGLTDDCAYLSLPPDEELVLKADAVVAGVHFLADAAPGHVAQKALRVNLSDLAAKGARPLGYLQTMALPRGIDDAWIEAYAAGLAADQARYAVPLLGGDITATDGPLSISITMLGAVPRGQAPLRSGARPGDRVFVTGTIGDALLGLAVHRGAYAPAPVEDRAFLVDRYDLPQPRLQEGRALLGIAKASADISDGLVADFDHIADASVVGIEIDAVRVPLSPAARRAVAADAVWLPRLLTAGDDYEIAFTATADPPLAANATEIGRVVAGQGVVVRDASGRPIAFDKIGYTHF
jgi:thiamine-monophosphate kinase